LPTDNVFVYDRAADANTLISHEDGTTDTTGDDNSHAVNISSDGSLIVFTSQSSNLVSGQTRPVDGAVDNVFVASRTGTDWWSHTLTLVTHQAGSDSTEGDPIGTDAGFFGLVIYPTLPTPAVTPDGAFVAYVSTATDLVDGQTDAAGENVYLYNVATNTS